MGVPERYSSPASRLAWAEELERASRELVPERDANVCISRCDLADIHPAPFSLLPFLIVNPCSHSEACIT